VARVLKGKYHCLGPQKIHRRAVILRLNNGATHAVCMQRPINQLVWGALPNISSAFCCRRPSPSSTPRPGDILVGKDPYSTFRDSVGCRMIWDSRAELDTLLVAAIAHHLARPLRAVALKDMKAPGASGLRRSTQPGCRHSRRRTRIPSLLPTSRTAASMCSRRKYPAARSRAYVGRQTLLQYMQ
jgi:hypothetical protein